MRTGDFNSPKSADDNRLDVLDRGWRAVCWLQISISPALAGAIVGLVAGAIVGGAVGLGVGIGIALLGLTAGIVWAERVRRTSGTQEFMSQLSATRDADRQEQNR